jgi:hypothetical protein
MSSRKPINASNSPDTKLGRRRIMPGALSRASQRVTKHSAERVRELASSRGAVVICQ